MFYQFVTCLPFCICFFFFFLLLNAICKLLALDDMLAPPPFAQKWLKKKDKKHNYGQKLELRIEIVESQTSPSFVLWSDTLLLQHCRPMRRTCRTQTTAQFADWAPNIRVCGSVDQSSVGSLKEPGCCIFLLSLFCLLLLSSMLLY